MNWKHLAFALVALSYHCMASALAPYHLPDLPERVECGVPDVPGDRANPTGRRVASPEARIVAAGRGCNGLLADATLDAARSRA